MHRIAISMYRTFNQRVAWQQMHCFDEGKTTIEADSQRARPGQNRGIRCSKSSIPTVVIISEGYMRAMHYFINVSLHVLTGSRVCLCVRSGFSADMHPLTEQPVKMPESLPAIAFA